MTLEQITPILLTYNEAPNIARVLDQLSWARDIVVVDSGSSDGTSEILSSYPRVRRFHRAFDSHANQWNFAIESTNVSTEWVLALDADYVLSGALVLELAALQPDDAVAGYETRFDYCVFGKPIRSALYPPVTTLFRRSKGRYEQNGHTQRLVLKGTLGHLRAAIRHDDRKSLGHWLWAQDRYADLEAESLLARPRASLRPQDRLRMLAVVTPWLVPLFCLTVRRGFLDGWPGIYYALQRGVAEAIIAIKLIHLRLDPDGSRDVRSRSGSKTTPP